MSWEQHKFNLKTIYRSNKGKGTNGTEFLFTYSKICGKERSKQNIPYVSIGERVKKMNTGYDHIQQ